MKFTLSWLKDHLETDATLAQVTDALTKLGLEVERVEDRAAPFAPFAVAYVEKADKHPDADRLKVCLVDTGPDSAWGKVQVVCGAPNARAGMKGVFAPENSFIPGTQTVLKKGNIRGKESCGMLVSEREMGLSDEHDGIIEVPDDVAVGTPFARLYGLDDPVIEVAVTPNRADWAGVRGIARDLAAAGLGTLKPLRAGASAGGDVSPVRVRLDFTAEARDACPHFAGRLVRGVRNGPSPRWLRDRLKAVGQRPISALVDITNYLALDLCRPLHVFDADRLQGDLSVRLARPGETLAALNDKTYDLGDGMTVVCDDGGPVGLGGVMGGLASACTSGTVNVLIEAAWFDPRRTAQTGRALQINSDARYRFERGVDPAFTEAGLDIATAMVLEYCGGVACAAIVAGAPPNRALTIAFEPKLTERLTGLALAAPEQIAMLERQGFKVEHDSMRYLVRPPSWRGDVEGVSDLVEDIARMAGYDKIVAVSLDRPAGVAAGADTTRTARARRTRVALAARGMDECVTWSFMPAERAALFGANDNQGAAALRLRNPISIELAQMRPTPLGNLLDAARRNADRQYPDVALFEVGPAFASARPDGQAAVATGIRAGLRGPRHWSGQDASRPVDALDAKADALAALAACGGAGVNLADTAQVSRGAPAWYHPGRSGALRLGATILAYFGEIHPAVLDAVGLRGAVAGFEIFLDAIPQPKKKPGTARSLLKIPPLQPVSRDFAFMVDDEVEAGAILRAARGTDKALIADAVLFDVYAGKGVAPGKKSVAITVTIQPREQTLTDKDLESLSDRIIGQVAAKTGGVLRQ